MQKAGQKYIFRKTEEKKGEEKGKKLKKQKAQN